MALTPPLPSLPLFGVTLIYFCKSNILEAGYEDEAQPEKAQFQ